MIYGQKKKCPVCSKIKYTVKKRVLNTSYVDEDRNFSYSCLNCYADEVEYYSERWEEYYGGCL